VPRARETLGDGTVGALASHMADSYLRIAAILQATGEMSPARPGRHCVLQTKEMT
jgi:hypothetical protein